MLGGSGFGVVADKQNAGDAEAPSDMMGVLRRAVELADPAGRFDPRRVFSGPSRRASDGKARGLGPMMRKATRLGLVRVVDDGIARNGTLYEFTSRGLEAIRTGEVPTAESPARDSST